VSCIGAGDCWAVGSTGRSGSWAALAEQYTGGGWSVAAETASTVSSGWLSELSAVTCAGSGVCWAVGAMESPPGYDGWTSIETNTGGGWSAVTSSTPAEGALLSGVACTSTGQCWAVGYSTPGSGGTEPLIERET
jgi:hypothetical protein